MSLQNLCTLFGPTLMKLSPKDNLQMDDMAREIKESMQQAQVLFYILQMHSEDRLVVDASSASSSSIPPHDTNNEQHQQSKLTDNQIEGGFSRLNLRNMFNQQPVVNDASAAPGSSSSSQQHHRIDSNNNTLNKANLLNKNSEERFPKSNMQTAL